MSFEGPVEDVIEQAIRASMAQTGLAYVVAAGNGGVDAKDTTPARMPEVITVGATDKNDTRGHFNFEESSNWGPAVDLFAPGEDIIAADTYDQNLDGIPNDTMHVNGTSFAAAYFSPATGSQFPLFPWMGFILLGAGLGQLYARWGAGDLSAFAQRALIAPGVVLVALAAAIRPRPDLLFGSGPGNFVPGEMMMRIGACLIILAAFAHLSRRLSRLPHVFGAVAQESLLIYFVHLCIVYGSVWNTGLVQRYGASRTPIQTVFFVALVLSAMAALAYYWNWFKHVHPRWARATSYVVGAALLIQLL